jgi:hypothetical protein
MADAITLGLDRSLQNVEKENQVQDEGDAT